MQLWNMCLYHTDYLSMLKGNDNTESRAEREDSKIESRQLPEQIPVGDGRRGSGQKYTSL